MVQIIQQLTTGIMNDGISAMIVLQEMMVLPDKQGGFSCDAYIVIRGYNTGCK